MCTANQSTGFYSVGTMVANTMTIKTPELRHSSVFNVIYSYKKQVYLRKFLNNSLCESSTVQILEFGISSSHSSWKFEWPKFSVIKSVDNLRYSIFFSHFDFSENVYKELHVCNNLFYSHLIETNQIPERSILTWVLSILPKSCSEK